MIDYSKLLDFVNDNEMSQEELFLLYSLYIRKEQLLPEKHKDIEKYYYRNSSKGIAFTKMVKELEEKGLLSRLKETEPILIKDLEISEKFTDLLFIQPDDVFSKVYQRYPQYGYIDGKSFTANMLDKDDKEYFFKHILKNADRYEASKIIFLMEEMFDFDYNTQKATRPASVGITKFFRNYHQIVKQWEEEQQGGYTNRLL